uniref:Uncharacterized protein n=1 Tax=Dulem virus 35 TaxID=3145753 RepID=A0AAU8AZC7_9CAUD
MKYKCIKELCIPKCDGDGFEIPNEYGYVEIGSIWEENNSLVYGGEVHLERVTGKGEFEWIEISRETLSEAFEIL